jgi:hypothetical protein
VKKRPVGNVGLHTCPVCHQLTRWDVFQIDKRATVYFVPVYTYASQKVVVCSNCHNGAEVTDLDIATLRSQQQATVPAPAATGVPAPQPAGFRPAAAPPVRAVSPPTHSAPSPPVPVAPQTAAARPAAPRAAVPAHPPVQPAHIAPPPRGTDRHLVEWLRSLQRIVQKYGWTLQDVRWAEGPYGVPTLLTATFLQTGTTYVISVHKTEQLAQRYGAALQGDPSVQQATQAGTHLVRVVERRVLRVHDARGVGALQLETWAKTVGWYPLPR